MGIEHAFNSSGSGYPPELVVEIESWGLKKGVPPIRHLMLDARALIDGHAKSADQLDLSLTNGQIDLNPYWRILTEALNRIPARRRGEPEPWKRPFQVLTFCAFGLNRSVALKHYLANRLRQVGVQVIVK